MHTVSSHKNFWVNLVGWYGMIALIGAYALVSFKVLRSTDLLYHLLNLSGAAGLFVITFAKKVYPSAVANVFWMLIAVLAIGSIWLR